MIDVTIENFETEVIAASLQTPVLVDFWAPWCGPCRTLGPILEKLEVAYGGRFKLVKIDSDQEQQLAGMFGIRSIPTCVLMSGGQPIDGFTGALPEGQLRAFLDKHLPPAEDDAATDADLPDAEEAAPELDLQAQLEQLQQQVQDKPDDEQARFDYIKLLLELGLEDDAKVAFAPVIDQAKTSQRYAALKSWMDALDAAYAAGDLPDALAALDAQIAAQRRDFEARFRRAQLLLAARQWTASMDELLEILMRDKEWHDGLARKTYVAILDLIEPPRPTVAEGQIPPEDPTVASYRRRLSSVVLS